MRRSHAEQRDEFKISSLKSWLLGGAKPIDTAGSGFGGRICAVGRYPAGPIRWIYGAWES